MTQSFKDFLAEQRPDRDAIQQATRYYLAQRTEDLAEDEMKEKLVASASNEREAEEVIQRVAADTALAENLCLAFLSSAWDEGPTEVEKIRGAFRDAKAKLPIIVPILIAIVSMYGMWLIQTGGVKKTVKTMRRLPDGTLEETETTEYYSATGPLSVVTKLFSPKVDD